MNTKPIFAGLILSAASLLNSAFACTAPYDYAYNNECYQFSQNQYYFLGAGNTHINQTFGHTVGIRGVRDNPQNNSNGYTIWIVGRQGNIGVSGQVRLQRPIPAYFDMYNVYHPQTIDYGSIITTNSSQPSPLMHVNEQVSLNPTPHNWVGDNTNDSPQYELKENTFIDGTGPSYTNQGANDAEWVHASGTTLAFLNVFDPQHSNSLIASIPCNLTSSFRVSQSVYIHYSWDTSSNNYNCYIDVF